MLRNPLLTTYLKVSHSLGESPLLSNTVSAMLEQKRRRHLYGVGADRRASLVFTLRLD
jgi:hypothetical protein